MSKKYCKLIMVSANNNNKYYEMTWGGGDSFNVKYGRIESGMQSATYPYSKWNSKYNEKINKGYKDVTDIVTTQVSDNKILTIGGDKKVEKFMTKMKMYTDNLVSSTYSVRSESVTQKQVDEAQQHINALVLISKQKKIDISYTNSNLINLYTTIPRKMDNVRNYLLPFIRLEDILEQEQDNLDAMASQVSMFTPKQDKKAQSLLDKLGITMKEAACNKDIQYLIDQCKTVKVESIFEVNKPEEDKVFNSWIDKQKNKKTRILIHGTRNSSVIPILEIGLKIRPKGNFQFSGKAYGDGNYFSETVQKSLNYTGWHDDKVLLVYEVHTGKPFEYDGWYKGNSFPLNYNELQKRGFDSTFVKAGNGLLNSEIIAYKEQQCKIKYIIHLK